MSLAVGILCLFVGFVKEAGSVTKYYSTG